MYRLSKYDIVITTYELLVSELKSRTKLIGQSDSEEDSDNPSHGRGVRSKPKTKSLKPKVLTFIFLIFINLRFLHFLGFT